MRRPTRIRPDRRLSDDENLPPVPIIGIGTIVQLTVTDAPPKEEDEEEPSPGQRIGF